MAKPKGVNRYRSGVKNPYQQVLIYREKGLTKVHIVDYEKGKVTTLEEKGPEEPTP